MSPHRAHRAHRSHGWSTRGNPNQGGPADLPNPVMNETEPTSPGAPARSVPVYDPGSSLSRTGYEEAELGVIGTDAQINTFAP
jgi:hypothetical protein